MLFVKWRGYKGGSISRWPGMRINSPRNTAGSPAGFVTQGGGGGRDSDGTMKRDLLHKLSLFDGLREILLPCKRDGIGFIHYKEKCHRKQIDLLDRKLSPC